MFPSLLASLGVLRGNFLPSSARFSQSLAVGLSDFSGHGNRLPCSAPLVKPYRDQPGHHLLSSPGCSRRSQICRGQTPAYHYIHESQLLSFFHVLSSYCTVVSVSEGTCALDGRVKSGGSWSEWRWVSRERTTTWGSSTTSSKALPPTVCCLVVTVVESTGSHLFMKPTIES